MLWTNGNTDALYIKLIDGETFFLLQTSKFGCLELILSRFFSLLYYTHSELHFGLFFHPDAHLTDLPRTAD